MSVCSIARTAVISGCWQYRYKLTRLWDTRVPRIIFIGLNPSTADAERDDPTIRRLIAFADDWGYGGFDMYNLFALQAREPAYVRRHANPVGSKNNSYLVEAAHSGLPIVACWGICGDMDNRAEFVARLFNELQCFGVNNDGSPKHPLYLPKDTQLRRYHA